MSRGLLALLLSLPLVAAAQESPLEAGPMQAHTTQRVAWVWVQGKGPGKVSLHFHSPERGAQGRVIGPAAFDPEKDHTAVIEVDGLTPAGSWEYDLSVDGQMVPGGPWTLRSLPEPGKGRVRIAFGSCLKPSVIKEQPIFASIAAAKPDVFLWLGDNLYYTDGDLDEASKLWRRNRVTRGLPSLRPLLAGSINLAQWDDHDYGANNSDKRYALKSASRDAFMAYWPNASAGEGDAGIYTKASLGPVDVFLCDDRWFRDPNRERDHPGKGILGEQQVRWLLAGLKASKAPVKVVATGGQFLARYHSYESWQSATHERDRILEGIKEADVQGVLFISGDRHLAEVIRWPSSYVGYDLWEVTSSPLANRWWPDGEKLRNPDREFVFGQAPNFGWLEVDAAARTIKLELRDVSGKTIWTRALNELWPAEPRRRF